MAVKPRSGNASVNNPLVRCGRRRCGYVGPRSYFQGNACPVCKGKKNEDVRQAREGVAA